MYPSLPLRSLRFAVLLLAFVTTAVLAAVPTRTLEKAEALLKSGKADEAYLMLEALEMKGAGDLVYDYLFATAALDSNRPSRATFIYERILAVEPNYVGVRADMGRAYFALGDYGRAKIEFETVLTFAGLPQDLRTQVEQYNKAATDRAQQKKLVSTIYAEGTIGFDNNVNSATSRADALVVVDPGFPLLTEPSVKTGDQYTAVAVGGELNYQIDQKYSAYFGGDLRKRQYRTWSEADNWSGDARLGLAYSGGRWLLKTGLTGGTYAQGSSGRIRDSVGLNADWRYAWDNATQFTANGSAVRYSYVPLQASNDNETFTGGFGWLGVFAGGKSVASLSTSFGVDKAINTRDGGDKNFAGLRFLVQQTFAPTLSAYVTAGGTKNSYSEQSKLGPVPLVTRREWTYDGTLAMTWNVGKGISLRPQISYVRNESDILLYQYDKTDYSLNLRADF